MEKFNQPKKLSDEEKEKIKKFIDEILSEYGKEKNKKEQAEE